MHSAKKTAQEVRAHSFPALFDDKQAALLADSVEIRTYREGELTFTSKPGKGTCFTIELPLARGD